MMKKVIISRKLVSVMLVALFMLSFAGAAVSQESQGTITGTIIAIDADTGKVSVQDESGKQYTLTVGSDVDLETFSSGDKVKIDYSTGGVVITSITKQ
jgi:P pilus assembly chaperone PapD